MLSTTKKGEEVEEKEVEDGRQRPDWEGGSTGHSWPVFMWSLNLTRASERAKQRPGPF